MSFSFLGDYNTNYTSISFVHVFHTILLKGLPGITLSRRSFGSTWDTMLSTTRRSHTTWCELTRLIGGDGYNHGGTEGGRRGYRGDRRRVWRSRREGRHIRLPNTKDKNKKHRNWILIHTTEVKNPGIILDSVLSYSHTLTTSWRLPSSTTRNIACVKPFLNL